MTDDEMIHALENPAYVVDRLAERLANLKSGNAHLTLALRNAIEERDTARTELAFLRGQGPGPDIS